MMLHVPPENQGQVVEVAYGWHEGRLYRRAVDRSDHSVKWYVADERSAKRLNGTWWPWMTRPSVRAWARCQAPADEPGDWSLHT